MEPCAASGPFRRSRGVPLRKPVLMPVCLDVLVFVALPRSRGAPLIRLSLRGVAFRPSGPDAPFPMMCVSSAFTERFVYSRKSMSHDTSHMFHGTTSRYICMSGQSVVLGAAQHGWLPQKLHQHLVSLRVACVSPRSTPPPPMTQRPPYSGFQHTTLALVTHIFAGCCFPVAITADPSAITHRVT